MVYVIHLKFCGVYNLIFDIYFSISYFSNRSSLFSAFLVVSVKHAHHHALSVMLPQDGGDFQGLSNSRGCAGCCIGQGEAACGGRNAHGDPGDPGGGDDDDDDQAADCDDCRFGRGHGRGAGAGAGVDLLGDEIAENVGDD